MKLLLNISEASILALHALESIAESGGLRRAPEMADELGASYNHLAKVLQRLTKAGLLAPVRGPRGGFGLTERGARATIGDILTAVEGNPGTRDCLLGGAAACPRKRCPFRGFLKDTNSRFETLLKTKVRDFVNTKTRS